MNEVTRIHLGRQPFTIAVDAHKQLREYLDAIREAVGKSHKEVMEEVELRMAELLIERGITGDKAILAKDIAYLREQLGKPGDFRGEEGDESKEDEQSDGDKDAPKRLFRDEKNGMIAGVSSGLAAYFTIDAVIVRLIFILLTVAFGWGILLYIILWILVPPAKSTSDRLQMRGKAVTIGSLTETVNREVTAAANRASKAGKATGNLINTILKILLGIVGAGLATVGVCALFGLAAGSAYLFTHTKDIIGGAVSFPVGSAETIFLISGLVAAGIISLLIFLLGLAMMKRKWAVPGWVTASIVGLFLTAASVGAVMAPDAISGVRDRYDKARVTTTRELPDFTTAEISGSLSFHYVESKQHKVVINHFKKQRSQDITTTVVNGKLVIDATQFKEELECDKPCISASIFAEAIIYAPNLTEVNVNGHTTLKRIQNGERYRFPDHY